MSINEKRIISDLTGYISELKSCYIESQQHEQKDIHFVLSIVKVLNKYQKLLTLISKLHKSDLVDCLATHHNNHLLLFTKNNISKELIEQYKTSVLSIKEAIKTVVNQEVVLNTLQLNIIKRKVYNINIIIQRLLSQPFDNLEDHNNMQATLIAYSFDQLVLRDQEELIEKLFLVKELWQLKHTNDFLVESNKFQFYQDPKKFIDNEVLSNDENIFPIIINAFIKQTYPYKNLRNHQLISLYERLKNYEEDENVFKKLLDKVYEESILRCSYNRLSESDYKLLHKFQNINVLMQEIETFKIEIVKSYLLNKSLFLQKVTALLLNQSSSIKILNLITKTSLLSLLDKIRHNVQHLTISTRNKTLADISNLQRIATIPLDTKERKKHLVLDQYTGVNIVEKYQYLFEQIMFLLDHNEQSIAFLNETFAQNLAQSYYFPHLTNSTKKIRQLKDTQQIVKEKLFNLNLINIFILPSMHNRITDLKVIEATNLEHNIKPGHNIKTANEFLSMLFTQLILKCSAYQLEVLYGLGKKVTHPTSVEVDLIAKVEKEIDSRMSFTKMMKSIAQGTKHEYNKLGQIKQKLNIEINC